jgi:hypothetical protein
LLGPEINLMCQFSGHKSRENLLVSGPRNSHYGPEILYPFPPADTILTEERDTWVECPVISFNFLQVIPADPPGHPELRNEISIY